MIKFFCDRHHQVLGRFKEIEKPKYILKDLSNPQTELMFCDECMADFTANWFYNKTLMEKIDQQNLQVFLSNLDKLKFGVKQNLEEPPGEPAGGKV